MRLLGAAEALAATLGRSLPIGHEGEYERTVAVAHSAMSEEAFAAAWEQGHAMTSEQAIEYALQEDLQEAKAVLPNNGVANSSGSRSSALYDNIHFCPTQK